MKGDPGSAGESGDRLSAIADQMIARRNDAGEGCSHRSAVHLRQDGVEGRALPVAGDEDRDIVLIKASTFRPACAPVPTPRPPPRSGIFAADRTNGP